MNFALVKVSVPGSQTSALWNNKSLTQKRSAPHQPDQYLVITGTVMCTRSHVVLALWVQVQADPKDTQQPIWDRMPTLPHTCCETLGKLLDFSDSQTFLGKTQLKNLSLPGPL